MTSIPDPWVQAFIDQVLAAARDPLSRLDVREALIDASARLEHLADALGDVDEQVVDDRDVRTAAAVYSIADELAKLVVGTVDRLIGPAVET
jgi:hypothetical protein